MPPGTITAWIPGGGEVPNRWQICDGSEIEMGPWKGKRTPDLTHAFLVGAAKEAVDVGSAGPREFYPPVEPGVAYAEIQETDKKTFCSSYELLNPGSASLSCRENSQLNTFNPKVDVSNLYDVNDVPYDPTYGVVYIMRVR